MSSPTSPAKKPRRFRKEVDKLYRKADFYRRQYAKKALWRSKLHKILEVISLLLSITITTVVTAAISGHMQVDVTQKLVIVLSALVAIIGVIIKPFFNPEEFIKLFYASNQFLDIREKAKALLLNRELTNDELRAEFHKLDKDYTDLKKIYIQYIDAPSAYYRSMRSFTVPGKRFSQLPPISGKAEKKAQPGAQENIDSSGSRFRNIRKLLRRDHNK